MSSIETESRPPGVPTEAWFSAKAGLWQLGPKDDEGELHGEVSYWDDTGTLVSIARKKHGVAHGTARRFHENGDVSQICEYRDGKMCGTRTFFPNSPESARSMSVGENVRRIELDYDEQGMMTAERFFDAEGKPVERDGSPRVRPAGVPAHAIARKGGKWTTGTWDEEGRRHGELHFYDADGALEAVETFEADLLHGRCCYFGDAGQTTFEAEYRKGLREGLTRTFYDDETLRGSYTYEADVLVRAEQYHRDGSLARRLDTKTRVLEEASGEQCVIPLPQVLEPRAQPPLARRIEELPSDAAISALREADLTPHDLAELLALAFGGDWQRDDDAARAARRLVREHDDAQLQNALRETGLDTAPRLQTPQRVRRLLEALRDCAAVDLVAAKQAFARGGGPAELVALDAPTTLAISVLERRMPHPERLVLSGMGLRSLPTAVRHLRELCTIEARSNRLESVPAELHELLFLRKLGLSSNSIRDLPSELAKLRGLEALMLSDNELDAVPETVWSLDELQTLDLSHNRLRSLPDRLASVPRLDTLWLNDNPLESLPPSMASLSSLTFLHLGNLPWDRPPDVIFELPKLETLWLASSALTCLPEAIGRLKTLEALMVWHSRLETLPAALFEMTHLKELRIRHNPLPPHTLQALKEALPDCSIL